jgi:7-cyano-7-deazaguanine synthase
MTGSIQWPPKSATTPLAVLCSGGLDSAILLGEALRVYPAVHPLYIRTGAQWEAVEFEYLKRFLEAVRTPALRPLVVLNMPVADLYGKHWSLDGAVPDEQSADEAVFLPGRNVILLSKALIWCHLNNVPEVATAPLGSNPFPDATDEFYDGFANIVSSAVAGKVRVLRPYATANLHKLNVLKRGAGMPLQHTFSCIQPMRGLHCGRCNKCAERKLGFRDADMIDPTIYA